MESGPAPGPPLDGGGPEGEAGVLTRALSLVYTAFVAKLLEVTGPLPLTWPEEVGPGQARTGGATAVLLPRARRAPALGAGARCNPEPSLGWKFASVDIRSRI